MTAFKKLKTIREFEKARMPHLRSHEDFDIVIEVGYHEDMGQPLTLKCLLLIGITSASTTQRKVHALVDAGILTRSRSASDRRSVQLGVSVQTRKLVDRYVHILHAQVPRK
ncbi:MAG: MarR family transcriptional regulator [Sideroxydans sp.]|nr:MarR family transcriptional regulator [Sideroxydans sp.]MDD5470602.1 MarR family transcriptional regulator [Sideroxydans sp.]